MGMNRDHPDRWKTDIAASVDMYNDWFMRFAPSAFRETRVHTTSRVRNAFTMTANLTQITAKALQEHPEILATLRMCACPPLAVDRLIGLAGVMPGLVRTMESKHRVPPRSEVTKLTEQLEKIADILRRMTDPDILVWIGRAKPPSRVELQRAASIIADRLCGAFANPIIRNAQEQRQLAAIKSWLEDRGYAQIKPREGTKFDAMKPGTFGFRMNVPVGSGETDRSLNIPVDAAIMPKVSAAGDFPILLEAKSAGDYTNTNKRRKEEATKIAQLRAAYGERIRYVLFLCGYFDTGYLGYEAAEGIDWAWEHRIDDLIGLGV